jgi:hypothetical protein
LPFTHGLLVRALSDITTCALRKIMATPPPIGSVHEEPLPIGFTSSQRGEAKRTFVGQPTGIGS